MDMLKLLKSFNNLNTYLTLVVVFLIIILLYFYVISPYGL